VWNAYRQAEEAYKRKLAQHRMKTRSHGERYAADPVVLAQSLLDNEKDQPGKKADAGKARVDLIPGHVIEWIGWVLQYGRHKYGDDEAARRNWRLVDSRRLYGSVIRHLMAWEQGVLDDEESGLPHLAHAICTLMQLCDKELERGERDQVMATIRSAMARLNPQDVG
jgi:mannose/cellobiose epimerase-like protein (N-acyl-D-glucosamine 2-epimerase family)